MLCTLYAYMSVARACIYSCICVSMLFSLKSYKCIDLSMSGLESNRLHFLLHVCAMASFDVALIQNSILLLPHYVLDVVDAALVYNRLVMALQSSLRPINHLSRIIATPISDTLRGKLLSY